MKEGAKQIYFDPKNSPAYSIKTLDELAEWGRVMQKKRWIISNYLREKQLLHFPSERGTGKTYLMLQLCIAVSKNFNFFLGEKIGRYGNTLYLNFEMPEDEIAERADELYKNPPESITQPGTHEVIVFSQREDFHVVLEKIIKIIKEKKPVLVVLDNFSIAFTDIERRPEIAKTYRNLLALKDDLGFSLIIVDHTKKGTSKLKTTSDIQSGSGIKTDLAEGDLFLRFSCQSENYRLFAKSKVRHGKRDNSVKLIEFDPKTKWFRRIADNVDEAQHLDADIAERMPEGTKLDMAAALKEKGYTYAQIANQLGMSTTTLHRKLNK